MHDLEWIWRESMWARLSTVVLRDGVDRAAYQTRSSGISCIIVWKHADVVYSHVTRRALGGCCDPNAHDLSFVHLGPLVRHVVKAITRRKRRIQRKLRRNIA